MNIMLFSKICARSGVGNHMRQLAEELVKENNNVWIVSSTNQQEIENNERLQFVLLPITSKNPFQMIRNLFDIHRLIESNNINVVHCHHRLAALYMRAYRLFWYIPIVYTLHLAPIPYDPFHRTLTYIGDRAIAVSTEIKEFMVDKLKIRSCQIDVIPNGVYFPNISGEGYNRDEILCKYHIPKDRWVLLMNSRIAEVKNHLLMVEAIHQLPEEYRGKIIVVCTGEKSGQYYTQVVSKIEAYGLQDYFRFIGWVDPYEILTVSDLLFLPSKAEGFPLSCIEAFFMKVPVARTKTGGYKDMEGICIPISSEDCKPINRIISTLVNNGGQQFEQLTDDAYQYACENFTIDKMTKNTVGIYKRVIESQG